MSLAPLRKSAALKAATTSKIHFTKKSDDISPYCSKMRDHACNMYTHTLTVIFMRIYGRAIQLLSSLT